MTRVPGIESIQDVVRYGLCISCGTCASAAPKNAIEMQYSKQQAMLVPVIVRPELANGKGLEFDLCPGKGCELIRIAEGIKSQSSTYDVSLGFIHKAWAIRSNNNVILERASSGGAMTAIAAYLLSRKKVAGVIATKMIYGQNGPCPLTVIAESLEELLECQGSKYCPVSTNAILQNVGSYKGLLAFIGTPCQIEGLRMLQERDAVIREKVRYVIGNFCGGMKNFREMHTIIKRHGFDLENIVRFRYRGGGQPGSMLIEDANGRIKYRPYPDYGTDTGYAKLHRCRLCVDATAELADFSCGDAWLPRFQSSEYPWSIVIARNSGAMAIINSMVNQGLVTTCDVSLEEIKQSQYTNLNSKKIRQAARRTLYQLLGKPIPSYDGGYPEEQSSLLFELKVYLTHAFLKGIERIRLYVPLIKLVRWIRRSNEFAQAKR